MKYTKNMMILIFLFFSLFLPIANLEYTELDPIIFGNNAESYVEGKGIFKIIANYKSEDKQKYLYIYPKNYDKALYINKSIFKIYFKEISKEEKTDVNYLDSDYSTLDFNSGLLIKISTLKYDKAYIFIITYGTAELKFEYNYIDDISFPTKAYKTNLQLNQFTLEKGESKIINYKIQSDYNEYLMVLTKTSLRNIEVNVKYKEIDYTKQLIANLYPNGYSIFIDTKDQEIFDINTKFYYITIKNKNIRDEIILLGFMHHDPEEIFTDKLINGYQFYLESNSNRLYSLKNTDKKIDQYFTYQIFCKKGEMLISGPPNDEYFFKDYNSMVHYNIESNGEIVFEFTTAPKRNSLYMQFIDYNDIEVAQKSLQALVSGSPKSMLIPAKKSMYHFLPKERESTNINYYLRPKTPNDENMFISFKTCKNYPEECVFTDKDDNSVNLIKNMGLWYTEETIKNELQIMYVYCEKECKYDILMTYDNDPLFMFPENNYTKFIGEEGQDTFILPVFEFLSNNQSIYIDLSIISGNAELTLYKNLDLTIKLNIEKEIIGNKQSYIISNESFSNSDYYKKDIYAVVKGDKNTFYNLMYGAGATNDKILDNNRVILESVYVDANKKKSFTFFTHEDNLYISITTPKCKSKINIDGKEASSDKNNFAKKVDGKGYHVFEIYLIEDELCKKGQKEEVILYAYNSDNTNILLSENTLVNSTVNVKEITFRHIFKPDFEQNADNSLSIELERLFDSKSLKFEYKLEKISFDSSASKSSTNSQLSTYVFGKKANLISNKQIKDVCGSSDKNEVCSLTITLSSSNDLSFSLYLNKNGNNIPRHIVDESLINIISQNSIRYYYIDANKDYDTEILINSYGQDLYYKYVVESGDNLNSKNIKFEKSDFKPSSNYHKIQVGNKECSSSPCRIYLGVYTKEKSSDKEASTTYEISYLFKQNNEKKTNVKLPLNYWVQYAFDSLSEITYSLKSYESGKLLLELYTIKENENDKCEVEATSSKDTLTSTEGYKKISIGKEDVSFTIKSKAKDSKCKFRFRASTVARDNIIVPLLPYSSEKCVIIKNSDACYYTLDISPENEADNVYFYIPETEDAFISVSEVEHGSVENIENNIQNTLSQLKMSEKDEVKRSNWHEEAIQNRNVTLIVGVKTRSSSNINLTLYTTFINKPEEVTLDQGEKKIFTIDQSSKSNAMSLKIKKSNSQFNKYKINIHAVKGNGLFTLLGQNYALGLDFNNKESISIIVDESDNDIEIVAKNLYNDESINEFAFSIDYTISTANQLFNELELAKINSYKVIKPGASDLSFISFYMKVNSTKDNLQSYDVNMNVKVFFSTPNFELKAYVVGSDFIEGKLSDVNKQPERSANGEIITYIGGENTDSEFTLSKIEIAGSKLKEFYDEVKKDLYIYVTFSTKEKKNNVRIDLYPYDITNNLPLAQNELFIHKLPAGTTNYQLLLVKSDNEFKEMLIEYISPSSDKYKMAIANLKDQKDYIKKNESNILDTNKIILDFGRNELSVKEDLDKNRLRYLLFNVFADQSNQETKSDQFVFKYKSNIYTKIYKSQDKAFSVDNSAGVKFKVDASFLSFSTGNSIFIIKAYKKSEIEGLNVDEDHLSLYLLFSDKKPTYTFYKSLNKEQIKKQVEQEFSIEWKEDGGEYLFTCVNVVVDNERTEYLGYKAETKEIQSSSRMLDYMRNHIFATIIIFIIILFVCGMICNIIRIDRKPKRQTVEKIEVDKIMEDM